MRGRCSQQLQDGVRRLTPFTLLRYDRAAPGTVLCTLPRQLSPAQGAFAVGNVMALLRFQTPRF